MWHQGFVVSVSVRLDVEFVRAYFLNVFYRVVKKGAHLLLGKSLLIGI